MYLGIVDSYDCRCGHLLYELAITFQGLIVNCQQILGEFLLIGKSYQLLQCDKF
jgi:hypothetical protein